MSRLIHRRIYDPGRINGADAAAFDGDPFILATIKDLIASRSIQTIVETGTCDGNTTRILCNLGPKVFTVEVDPRRLERALPTFANLTNLESHLNNSPDFLREILPRVRQPVLFYLDAHWGPYCPLQDELKMIAQCNVKDPVIAIHDFYVPDYPDLGFDTYNDQPYTYEWIKPALEAIGSYRYFYNQSQEAAGARRGIIYILFGDCA